MKLEKKYNIKAPFFRNEMPLSDIDDDHKPFLKRGVPILHLITIPFPNVWHTKNDDINHLHFPTIVTLIDIFHDFLIESLNLKI